MKAPNKIWLSKFEEDPGDNEYRIFEQWSLEPISNAENEEYIRKDALLEWLEKKVQLSYGVATDALVEVIEKVKAL